MKYKLFYVSLLSIIVMLFCGGAYAALKVASSQAVYTFVPQKLNNNNV